MLKGRQYQPTTKVQTFIFRWIHFFHFLWLWLGYFCIVFLFLFCYVTGLKTNRLPQMYFLWLEKGHNILLNTGIWHYEVWKQYKMWIKAVFWIKYIEFSHWILSKLKCKVTNPETEFLSEMKLISSNKINRRIVTSDFLK